MSGTLRVTPVNIEHEEFEELSKWGYVHVINNFIFPQKFLGQFHF